MVWLDNCVHAGKEGVALFFRSSRPTSAGDPTIIQLCFFLLERGKVRKALAKNISVHCCGMNQNKVNSTLRHLRHPLWKAINCCLCFMVFCCRVGLLAVKTKFCSPHVLVCACQYLCDALVCLTETEVLPDSTCDESGCERSLHTGCGKLCDVHYVEVLGSSYIVWCLTLYCWLPKQNIVCVFCSHILVNLVRICVTHQYVWLAMNHQPVPVVRSIAQQGCTLNVAIFVLITQRYLSVGIY